MCEMSIQQLNEQIALEMAGIARLDDIQARMRLGRVTPVTAGLLVNELGNLFGTVAGVSVESFLHVPHHQIAMEAADNGIVAKVGNLIRLVRDYIVKVAKKIKEKVKSFFGSLVKSKGQEIEKGAETLVKDVKETLALDVKKPMIQLLEDKRPEQAAKVQEALPLAKALDGICEGSLLFKRGYYSDFGDIQVNSQYKYSDLVEGIGDWLLMISHITGEVNLKGMTDSDVDDITNKMTDICRSLTAKIDDTAMSELSEIVHNFSAIELEDLADRDNQHIDAIGKLASKASDIQAMLEKGIGNIKKMKYTQQTAMVVKDLQQQMDLAVKIAKTLIQISKDSTRITEYSLQYAQKIQKGLGGDVSNEG